MSKARDLANAGTALGAVTATELGYVDGVTSAIQTQIDSKIGSASAINPTIVDVKGDIIAATAADTVARLAVGANDTVLTADSTAATGLKWAAVSAFPTTATATVATTQTLTSTSYSDLATVGPAVTVTTGTKALVIITAQLNNNSSGGNNVYASYAVSGATTIAASDATCIQTNGDGGTGAGRIRVSAANLVTLTAGSNTFTMKYRCGAGNTGAFSERNIFVMNLA
jgi:hypothetical protein